MPESRSVLRSARLIAVCTLASRLTGLVRDMLLAQTLGLGRVFDAFNYAFQFPNLFRRLFGEGALAAAFVPVFTRTLENEGRPAAWRLLARSLALMTLGLVALIVAIQAVLAAIWLFGPAGHPDDIATRRLLLALTSLMLPFMLTICLVALLSSVLNCVGSFVPAALTPLVLNVLMIVGIVGVGPLLGAPDEPERRIFGVAICVLVAGVLQLSLLVPVLRKHGVAIGWKLDTRDPNVRRVLGLMVPVLIGQGVLILGPFLDSQICILFSAREGAAATANWFGVRFAYPLREGALSALTNAQRLYQFPLGVFAISLAVAALPALTRLANRSAWGAWNKELIRTLRLTLFVGLLTGAMMIVWGAPIVRLLFEYRNFDAGDTSRVARVMFWYGFGLWAFCVQHIVLRGFYSLSDIRTPLRISCLLLPVNLVISLVLIWLPGVRESAFAISSGLTSIASVLTGMILLQRRTQTRLLDRRLAWGAARMLIAAVGAALAVYWLGDAGLSEMISQTQVVWAERAVETFTGLMIGTAAFVLIATLLRLREPWLWVERSRIRG